MNRAYECASVHGIDTPFSLSFSLSQIFSSHFLSHAASDEVAISFTFIAILWLGQCNLFAILLGADIFEETRRDATGRDKLVFIPIWSLPPFIEWSNMGGRGFWTDVLPSSVLAVRFYDSYHRRAAVQSTRFAHCIRSVFSLANSLRGRERERHSHRDWPIPRMEHRRRRGRRRCRSFRVSDFLFLFWSNFVCERVCGREKTILLIPL